MDEKFEKSDPERTKVQKMEPKKCRTPVTPSLRGDPLEPNVYMARLQMELCRATNIFAALQNQK